jgi:cell wall assembly regulator SMI1
LANLEAIVRSVECGSFSVAARRRALTPAAVSRSVAMLERKLGVRLPCQVRAEAERQMSDSDRNSVIGSGFASDSIYSFYTER